MAARKSGLLKYSGDKVLTDLWRAIDFGARGGRNVVPKPQSGLGHHCLARSSTWFDDARVRGKAASTRHEKKKRA
jgi:hypothetical protein